MLARHSLKSSDKLSNHYKQSWVLDVTQGQRIETWLRLELKDFCAIHREHVKHGVNLTFNQENSSLLFYQLLYRWISACWPISDNMPIIWCIRNSFHTSHSPCFLSFFLPPFLCLCHFLLSLHLRNIILLCPIYFLLSFPEPVLSLQSFIFPSYSLHFPDLCSSLFPI